MEQYSKYKDGGLRQKLHDAIRARKCIRRMAAGHLCSACPEPPKLWEADFNAGKAAFWGPKPKQVRPQWLPSTPTLKGPKPSSSLLMVVDAGLNIALDTCSEISIGSKRVLINLRLAEKAIFIEGVGGLLFLEEEGDFLLADNNKITVFVVGQSNLPPNAQILLGIEHIKDLRISVDFAIDRPFCQLEKAMAYGQASLARFSSLVSLSSEKEGPRSSQFASDFLDDSLAVAPICVFMMGLCLSL
jgi:hypothetical protein